MTSRQTFIVALLMVGCAAPAAATTPTTPAATANTPAAATAPSVKPGVSAPARTGAAKRSTTAHRPHTGAAVESAARSDSTAARDRADASKRTLDDIHIEGEIPVPQVLFITTRDQRRFMGFQYRRYLRTSRKIGEDTAVPSRITVTGAATMPERSHSDD